MENPIVSAVIKLAEELGMCTLAEGVENQEQLDRLRETGCEQVQGFLFSRAQPSSKLAHKQNVKAKPALTKKAFRFDPDNFTFTNKKTGEVIKGQ